jgi:hypothetical protein
MARGVVLYRGPSLIDGGPIVAIATWRSQNSKTGDVPQVWILREDTPPLQAVKSGADRSICGDCPLRGRVIDGRSVGRACYVVLHQAPTAVWLAYRRGIYREVGTARLARLFAGAFVRLGAYGDPAAVPIHVWRAMLADARGWAAYTHRWKHGADLQTIAMASCESDADTREAVARGYRVFRVVAPGAARLPGHAACPASAEEGQRLTCQECRACNGNALGVPMPHVQIQIHGHGRRYALPLLASEEGGRACAL